MPHIALLLLLALFVGSLFDPIAAEEVSPPEPTPPSTLPPASSGGPARSPSPAAVSSTQPASQPAGQPAEVPTTPGAGTSPVKAIPPSPSTVPGVRIWPDPMFTHWPAVVYPDEQRNVAFSLPVRQPGTAGTIGWKGGKPLPFTLPIDLERISGLLPLPQEVDLHQAELTLAGVAVSGQLSVRVVDARASWPQTALKEGFPVDAAGVPVVLLDRRRDANQERKWALVTSLQKPRPTGQALFLGDSLAAMGASAVDGLDVRVRLALDERQPVHAQLVGFALDAATWHDNPLVSGPRTILWSPGNQALLANTWTSEEERFLGVLRSRLEELEIFPRLVLVLPTAPIDDREPARALARERRDLLRRAAAWQGWVILDVERVAGPAEESYRLAEGVYAPGPVNQARNALAAALRAELIR